jgi:hypothetical protein
MDATLATAVYVDGYNLYYGRLRGTPYKWLDLVALFEALLHEQEPHALLSFVRYFSAPALARFATNGDAAVLGQQDYHRALERRHASRLAIQLGAHHFNRAGVMLPRCVPGVQFDRKDRVRVWKVEEKQTDVNIALAMYRDASKGALQQQVLCSNDRDAAPVLRAIREDFPHIRLGVVAPRSPSRAGEPRSAARELARFAHWTRHHLLDDELARSQLPPVVTTGRKPIRRPAHW